MTSETCQSLLKAVTEIKKKKSSECRYLIREAKYPHNSM
jgi:hypothetical protein